jgi:hypothetical protein
MNKFFVLESEEGIRFGRKWSYAEPLTPINLGESENCPICSSPVSSKMWLPPHKIKISSAKPEKWGDFVWGAGFPLLVSCRFKEVYDKEGLSGISYFSSPVDVVRMGPLKSGQFSNPPPIYHLIHVPWGGANQDDTASGLKYEQPEKITCAYCRSGFSWQKQDRIVIEEGSWDGSDIFKPRNAPVQFMVSGRFKHIAEGCDFKNIWLIPAENYGFDVRRRGLWYVNDPGNPRKKNCFGK